MIKTPPRELTESERLREQEVIKALNACPKCKANMRLRGLRKWRPCSEHKADVEAAARAAGYTQKGLH